MNEFFVKSKLRAFFGTNGENSLETKVHRELARKKNGTYFCVKPARMSYSCHSLIFTPAYEIFRIFVSLILRRSICIKHFPSFLV